MVSGTQGHHSDGVISAVLKLSIVYSINKGVNSRAARRNLDKRALIYDILDEKMQDIA